MYWASLKIILIKKKHARGNSKRVFVWNRPSIFIKTSKMQTHGSPDTMYLHHFVSVQKKTPFPLSSTSPTNANVFIQGFYITHNWMPTLSSHPSGTNASPTRSTGAVGGQWRVPAVPAHLSQPWSCCAKPQLSPSNWPHRLKERNASPTHSQLWRACRHKIVLSGRFSWCQSVWALFH